MLGALKEKINPEGKRKPMSKLELRTLKWTLQRAEKEKVLENLESYNHHPPYSCRFTRGIYFYRDFFHRRGTLIPDVAQITNIIRQKIDFSVMRWHD